MSNHSSPPGDADGCAQAFGRTRSRLGRAVALSALTVAVALFLFLGQIRHPAGPARGKGIRDLSAAPETSFPAPPTFHVATFNIHSGVGRNGRRDMTRTIEVLTDADFIGLNEVRGVLPWDTANQAQAIGTALRRGWLFAPTERRWWCDHFGNALVSRLPIGAWERIPLAGTQSKGHRNMLKAEAVLGGRSVRIIVTHIARGVDRSAQLTQVIRAFLDLTPPCVLMGDLNTRAEEEPLRSLLRQPDTVDALAHAGTNTTSGRIDWIVLRGLEVVRAGLRDNGASDHPCAWAEVRLPASLAPHAEPKAAP